jgi:leucyl/phenylalanyl-tRNA--protein transferase
VPAAVAGGPVEPPRSSWALGVEGAEPGEDLVGVGADLEPGTVLLAYRRGLFPMGLGRRGARPLGWWSPDPRGILPLPDLVVSRSLRRSIGHYEVRINTAFEQVVAGCAAPGRVGRWITPAIARAYTALHHLGWAHSVECWSGDELAGGLYGVAIGGLFAGESMFHVRRDASKVALVALVELLREAGPTGTGGSPASGGRLLDVQWRTDHLATLGVVEVPRTEYLRRLEAALELPLPAVLRDQSGARHAVPR